MTPQPAYNLGDMLDGTVPATFTLHLSDTPLPTPFALGMFNEATFLGYKPATVYPVVKMPQQQDAGILNGYAVFTNENEKVSARVRGAWLTVSDPLGSGQDILVSVVFSFDADIPPGTHTLQVNFQSYELEAS